LKKQGKPVQASWPTRLSPQSFRGIRERRDDWLTARTLRVVLPTLWRLLSTTLPKEDGRQEVPHSRNNGAGQSESNPKRLAALMLTKTHPNPGEPKPTWIRIEIPHHRGRLTRGRTNSPDLSTRWLPIHSPLDPPEGEAAHGPTGNRESSCQRSWSHLTLMGFRPLQRLGQEKRPAPGLPHPAVLHSQAFSTSQCLIPLLAVPALFHAGSTPGVLDPAELSPPEDRVPSRFPIPSWRSPNLSTMTEVTATRCLPKQGT
jgi:hypothetical protein